MFPLSLSRLFFLSFFFGRNLSRLSDLLGIHTKKKKVVSTLRCFVLSLKSNLYTHRKMFSSSSSSFSFPHITLRLLNFLLLWRGCFSIERRRKVNWPAKSLSRKCCPKNALSRLETFFLFFLIRLVRFSRAWREGFSAFWLLVIYTVSFSLYSCSLCLHLHNIMT